jgi:hypothetical protein
MFYMLLVFTHLLCTSMALGAIVATDLRMLSKLAQDRVRIPPPNDFVARLVTVALAGLYASGITMVAIGAWGEPDYLHNEKLLGKFVIVGLLTLNAVVLHRFTFPRLARGRSVSRWKAVDWLVVAVPVAASNSMWMFCAFLGIARPWNHAVPLGRVLELAVLLFLVVLAAVCTVLGTASRRGDAPLLEVFRRSLASVGNLGKSSA